ncbi:MAG: AMP-binding protein [Desulfobacter sp.]|nr:MAG: AMP-binding protein [Desulfobacter sp.]
MKDSRNLLECLYHWEKHDPDRRFMTQPMGGGDANLKSWTWKETADEARRMASYLKGLDFPAGSHIALCSKNCAHWILADLAIWMAGHVSIPIFPVLTPDIVAYILEHSESKLLFVGKVDPVWEEMKKGVPEGMPQIAFPLAPASTHPKWDDIIAGQPPLADPVPRDPDEIATIMYTSGSTGTPKGVMMNFGAMNASAKGICNYLDSRPQDRLLSYLPLSHTMERWLMECQGLYIGFQLFFAESLDTFLADLQRAGPTLFLSVPRLWLKFQLGVFEKIPPKKLDLLLRIPVLSGLIKKKILTGLGLNQVRFAGSGSAPIPKEILEWYRRLGLELLEGYGMTENMSYSHCSRPGQIRAGYIGAPYPDVQQRISEAGEVLVKSPGNMVGYYKMPEKTAETFTEDGFIKTGDMGELDELRRLKITGRIKELFKTSKGKFVAPAPIENRINIHPRVESSCVAGSGCSAPFGVVMLSAASRSELAAAGGKPAVEADLKDHLATVNDALLPHEKLAFLAVAKDEWSPENGFLTPTMKLKRARLEETYSKFAEEWFHQSRPVVWEA